MTGASGPALRIAFVLGLATGGTASHVAVLAAGCRAAGCAVSFFAPARTLVSLDQEGTAVFPADIADRPRPARDAAAIARLRAGLRGWRPDVVHAHGIRAGAFAALARAPGSGGRSARPALVTTVHNAPPGGRVASLIYRQLERICARRSDLVLCASADLLARMRERGATAEQFDVPAPAGRPPAPAEVAAARADVGAGGAPVILAVARLAPQKGLDVLIEAVARLGDRDPAPVTVIAGDGPLAAPLAEQARQSGAGVRMLGARDDVAALLAVADLVVVPSRWEARALIVQEAMRAGRPVVATSTGGTPELTGSDAAVLVPPGDPAALAQAISAVLDDPALATRIGRAALARSATFPSEQDAVSAALAIYARLAAARPPARARR
jgi:glycosyltransferase involved in cell wall biosynthesis